MDYILLPDSETDAHETEGFWTGMHVQVRDDVRKVDGSPLDHFGQDGVVVGWGRGAEADERFRATGDFECLIDNEGPLVRWEEAAEADWYPGQAMALLQSC